MHIQICYLRMWIKKEIRQPIFAIFELAGGSVVFLLFVLLSLSSFSTLLLPPGHQFAQAIRPHSLQYLSFLCSVRGVAVVPSKGPLVEHFDRRLKEMGCLTLLFQNSSQLQNFILQKKINKQDLMGAVEILLADGLRVKYRVRLDPTTHLLNRPEETLTSRTFSKEVIFLSVQNLIDNFILQFYGVGQQLQHSIKTKPSSRPRLYSNLFDKMGQFIDIVPVLSLFLSFCKTAAILRVLSLEGLSQLYCSKSGRVHWHLSVWVWRTLVMLVQCALSIGVYKLLQSRVDILVLATICLVGVLNIAVQAIAVAHLLVRFVLGPLFSFLCFLALYLPMNIQRKGTTVLRPLLLGLGPSGMGLTLGRYLYGVSVDEVEEEGLTAKDIMWQVGWLFVKLAVAYYLNYERRIEAMSDSIVLKSLRVKFRNGRSMEIRDREFQCGQIVSVAGRNGSGKSTLMQVLANRAKVQERWVRLLGLSVEKAQHQVSYLQQNSHSVSFMTVQENLQFMAELSGFPQRAALYLQLMCLQPFKELRSSCLSAGQARRLQLAMRVLGEERVWLLDQPLNKVDQKSTQILKEFIKKQSKNRIIFISSHSKHHLEDLATAQIQLQVEEEATSANLPAGQSFPRGVLIQLRALLQMQLLQLSLQRVLMEFGIPTLIILFCLLVNSLKIHQNYPPDPDLDPTISSQFQFQILQNSIQVMVSDLKVGTLRKAVLAADKQFFKERLGIEIDMKSFPLPINYKGSITNSLNGCLVAFLLLLALNFQATSLFQWHGKNLSFSKLLFRSGLNPALYFSGRVIVSVCKVLVVSLVIFFLDENLLRVQGIDFLEMSVLTMVNFALAAFLMQSFGQERAVLFFAFNFTVGTIIPLLLLVLLLFLKNAHSLLLAAKFLLILPSFAFGLGMILPSASLYLKTFNEIDVDPQQLLFQSKMGMLASSLMLIGVLCFKKHTHDRYHSITPQLQPETSRQICMHTQELLQFKDLEVFYPGCFTKGFSSKPLNGKIIEGQTLWLKGPNGVGKSSVLKVLANQPLCFQGQIRSCVGPEHIGLSKQWNELPLELTVRKVVEIVSLARKLTFSSQQLDSALRSLGLGLYGQTPLGELSGGYLKKANLLTAMLGTQIWLLDEPWQQLDEQSRGGVGELREGRSVLVVSHRGPWPGASIQMR